MPPNFEESLEAFPGLPICSLVDFHTGNDQNVLDKDRREYMGFQMTQEMCQPTRLV